jgi:hypothetical protein
MMQTQEIPKLINHFSSYEEQSVWLKGRDVTTTDNILRNIYFPQTIPSFTSTGFKPVKTPPEIQRWLLDFVNRSPRSIENWHRDSTQLNFHQHPTAFYNLDSVREEKEYMANKYIRPLLAEWVGLPEEELEMTSFYGVREYPNGTILKPHVDRIDTHVFSATLSVKKLQPEIAEQNPWPLEVIRLDNGEITRYDHPEGTMVMYESAALVHGRPTRNTGGPHLGCFVHYRPKNADWQTMANKARMGKGLFEQRVPFVQTAHAEYDEQEIVYTEQDYVEHTG